MLGPAIRLAQGAQGLGCEACPDGDHQNRPFATHGIVRNDRAPWSGSQEPELSFSVVLP
jgi:hypothetical protein